MSFGCYERGVGRGVVHRLQFPRFFPEETGSVTVYRPGHYGAGLLAWSPIAFVLATRGHPQLALFGGAGVVALTPVPDYDHRVPFVEHRGITHTFAFAALVAATLGAAGWWLAGSSAFVRAAYGTPELIGGFAATVGGVAILAHLAADVVTPAGIEPFSPLWGRNYSLGLVSADDGVANYGLFLAGLGATGAVAYLSLRVVA